MVNQHPQFKGEYLHDSHPVWWELERMGLFRKQFLSDDFKFNVTISYDRADKEVQLIGKCYTLNHINNGSTSEKYIDNDHQRSEVKGEGIWISSWQTKGKDLILVDSIRQAMVMHEKMNPVQKKECVFANVVNCRPTQAKQIIDALQLTHQVRKVIFSNEKVRGFFERKVAIRTKAMSSTQSQAATITTMAQEPKYSKKGGQPAQQTQVSNFTNSQIRTSVTEIFYSLKKRAIGPGSYTTKEEYNFYTTLLQETYQAISNNGVDPGLVATEKISKDEVIKKAQRQGLNLAIKPTDLYFHKEFKLDSTAPYVEVSLLPTPSTTHEEFISSVIHQSTKQKYPKIERDQVSKYIAQPVQADAGGCENIKHAVN